MSTTSQKKQNNREQQTQNNEETAIRSETLFDVLNSHRRRTVLSTLSKTEGKVDFSDLVDRVAKQENENDEISSKERNRVWTSLYQTHIPRLDNENVINYNPNDKTLCDTEQTNYLNQYIDAANEPENAFNQNAVTWNRYFAISSIITLLLYGLSAIPLPSTFTTLQIALSLLSFVFLATTTATYAMKNW